jgi:hypothetical protein
MEPSAKRIGPGGRWRTWIILTAILAAALGARLISLTHEAVWYDELIIVVPLDSPNVVEYLRNALPRNPVPPGFIITEYFWSRLAGTGVAALRVWPLLCGITGLGVLFMLTRRLLGERTALFATLWVSFVYWHIHYSQEIRFYPLSSLFALLSVWTFVEWAVAPRPARLALHILVNVCMVWTHPLTAFLCVAQATFLLLFRRNHLRILAAWFGLHFLLALSLAAFVGFLNQDAAFAQTAWIPRPTLWGGPPSVKELVSMISGVFPSPPTNAAGCALLGVQPWTGSALIALHVAAVVYGVRGILRPRAAPASTPPGALPPRETAALLVLWLILPPVFVFIASYLWRPMFIVRYVLFASFPAYILLAHFLAARPRAVMAAALALLIAHDALFYFPGPMRAPFDQVAAAIQKQSAAPPEIYLDDMLSAPSIEFYWRGPKPQFLRPTELEKMTQAAATPGVEVWLILTDRERFERRAKFLRKDGITIATRKFAAGRTLWTIHVLSRDAARGP